MHFGPVLRDSASSSSASSFAKSAKVKFRIMSARDKNCLCLNRAGCQPTSALSGRLASFLREGLPALALDVLLNDLGRVVGANDPSEYSLEWPYNKEDIQKNPYLRLRLGFTFEEIVSIFRSEFSNRWLPSKAVELLVSALIDAFIDDGAMVPTFTLHGGACARVYRKGEANPRWDEEFRRLQFAVQSLPEKDRKDLMGRGRTRIAKINAILAMSSAGDGTSLSPGALERGTVGTLTPSVVERHAGELTGLMRRLGLWD